MFVWLVVSPLVRFPSLFLYSTYRYTYTPTSSRNTNYCGSLETRHAGKQGDTTPKRRGSLLNYLDQTQTMARKLGQEEEGGRHQEDVHGG